MATWYSKIVEDIGNLGQFLQYYEQEYTNARGELIIRGTIENLSKQLPPIVEQRFSQLQEIEAVLEFLNITQRKCVSGYYRKYLENYQRQLSSRDIEKYIDGEEEVVNYQVLINEVALLRNRWLGIVKSLETKQFQLNNVIKLRVAGLDDASI
jgi:uncharacterized protein YbgA (DUF1722 family)